MADVVDQALEAFRAGDLAQAELLLTAALAADPRNFNATHLLAGVRRQAGDRSGALALLDRALALNPTAAPAHANRASLLVELGRLEDAAQAYGAALAQRPDHAENWLNRGRALASAGRTEAALESFEAALRLTPNDDEAVHLRATALAVLGRFDDALAAYDALAARRPHDAELLSDQGIALYELGRFDEATEIFNRAMALQPGSRAIRRNSEAAHYNRSAALLAEGDIARGFAFYEHRRASGAVGSPDLSQGRPQWRGEKLDGVLHLWAEMGVGEAVLFSRFLPFAHARAPRLVLECDPRLAPLMRRAFPFIENIVDAGAFVGDAQAQCALPSLAWALGVERAGAAAQKPYLIPDAERVRQIRRGYEGMAQGRPLIGIAWYSSNLRWGERKSSRLADWEKLLCEPCLFVNLQYGETGDEIAGAARAFGCDIFSDPEVDQISDLDAFAAQIGALDTVVTVSNTTAHMGGAQGVRGIVLVPPERRLLWYWGKDDAVSFWYPSLRLVAHDTAKGWTDQVACAAQKLKLMFKGDL